MEVLISRDRQWAIDEARIHLERFAPRAADVPMTYLEPAPSDKDAHACAEALQELDYIPWPRSTGQLVVSGAPRFECDATILALGPLGASFGLTEPTPGCEPCHIAKAWKDENGSVSRQHLAGFLIKTSVALNANPSSHTILKRGFDGERGHVKADDPWMFAMRFEEGQAVEHDMTLGAGQVGMLLATLATLLTPCGYFIRKKSKRAKGKSSRKKNDNAQTLYMQIGYDRMKNLFPSQDDREVPLTFRRGHIRHLWKLSGVNKLELPNEATARLLFALEKRVRRIYISPTWYGTTHAEDADNEYDFDGEDMELSHGGSNN